jgi:hypothetical protein
MERGVAVVEHFLALGAIVITIAVAATWFEHRGEKTGLRLGIDQGIEQGIEQGIKLSLGPYMKATGGGGLPGAIERLEAFRDHAAIGIFGDNQSIRKPMEQMTADLQRVLDAL